MRTARQANSAASADFLRINRRSDSHPISRSNSAPSAKTKKPPKIGALMIGQGKHNWEAVMPAERGAVDPAASRREAAPSARHILVVDDDQAMLAMLTEYLEGENFRVSGVTDGNAMAQVMREEDVDLIILDMKLGADDGLDLMRRLSNPPEAPIIIITGHR